MALTKRKAPTFLSRLIPKILPIIPDVLAILAVASALFFSITDCFYCRGNPAFFILPAIISAAIFLYFSRNKETLCKLLFALIFIASSVSFFSGGIFSRGPLSHADFPFHYYNSLQVSDNLLPNFLGTKGWSDDFQLGYPPLYDLSPGEYLTYSAIRLSLFWETSPEVAYRLVVLLSFLSLPIALVFFMRKAGFGKGESYLGGALLLASFNDLFFFSNSRFYSASASALVFLGLLIKEAESDGRPRFSRIASAALFLAFSFLFHSFIGLLAIFLAAIAILSFISRKGLSKSVMLSSFSIPLGLLPVAHYVATYFSSGPLLEAIRANLRETWSFIYMIKPNFVIFIFLASPLVFAFFFSGLLSEGRILKERGILFSALAPALLVATAFAIHYARKNYSRSFSLLEILGMPDKYFSLAFVFMCAVAAAGLFRAINSKNKIVAGAAILAIAFTAIFHIAYRNELFSNPSSPPVDDHITRSFEWNNTFYNVFFLGMENGLFSSESRLETASLETALAELNSSGRILLEINGDSDGHIFGGFAYSLFPEKTGKMFVGGPTFSMLLPFGSNLSQFTNYLPGRPFGKNITLLSESEFKRLLDRANVEYVAVWTNESKTALSRNSPLFERIPFAGEGFFSIYRYSLSQHSFLSIPASGHAISNSVIEFSPKRKEFSLCNPPEEISLSMRHSGEWSAEFRESPSGRKISLETRPDDRGLLIARLPETGFGCGTLSFEYEERPGFIGLQILSIISLIGLFWSAFLFPDGGVK